MQHIKNAAGKLRDHIIHLITRDKPQIGTLDFETGLVRWE